MKDQETAGAVSKSLWVNSAIMARQLDNGLGAIHGIGMAEYMVLDSLAQAPGSMLRRVDIADAMARTASGITRLLMPMEKIGLVSKESNARDARVSLVKITAKGKELYNDATITLNEKSEHLLKNLGKAKSQSLLEMLAKM